MSQYWWGEYTDELAEKYWIDNGEGRLIGYASEKEFNYCPMCGMSMLEENI